MTKFILYFMWVALIIFTLFNVCSCGKEPELISRYESSLDEMSVEYKDGKYYVGVDNKQLVISDYAVIIDSDVEIIVYDYEGNNDKIEFHINGGFDGK